MSCGKPLLIVHGVAMVCTFVRLSSKLPSVHGRVQRPNPCCGGPGRGPVPGRERRAGGELCQVRWPSPQKAVVRVSMGHAWGTVRSKKSSKLPYPYAVLDCQIQPFRDASPEDEPDFDCHHRTNCSLSYRGSCGLAVPSPRGPDLPRLCHHKHCNVVLRLEIELTVSVRV